jgi:uncharacterized protein (UPF0332 family)
MQRPIKPEWLLRQARDLADKKERGQPRNADLRRACSAAYYALFHHIVLSVVDALMPGCSDEQKWRLARQFQHAAVRQVCKWVSETETPQKPVEWAVVHLRDNTDLVEACEAFVNLYELRHQADYDHLAEFNKPETLSKIEDAEGAIEKFQDLAGTPDFALFISHVTLKSQIQNV